MKTTTYAEAPQTIQRIIDQCPRDGGWREIDGYHASISDDNSRDQLTAAVYEPGSTPDGECDWYVDLSEVAQ